MVAFKQQQQQSLQFASDFFLSKKGFLVNYLALPGTFIYSVYPTKNMNTHIWK